MNAITAMRDTLAPHSVQVTDASGMTVAANDVMNTAMLARPPTPFTAAPSPRLTPLTKINAGDALRTLFAVDLLGAILAACAIFHLYADPLHYDYGQLWAGLIGFVAAWAFNASRQKLYVSKTLLGHPRDLMLGVVTTWAMTFGMLLFVGFGLNLIGGVSRVWLLTWAASALIWSGMVRIVWRAHLGRLLRRGSCLERTLVLARSAQSARRLGETVARESHGHIGVVATAALPGTVDAPSLDWVEDAVRAGRIDHIIVGDFSGVIVLANALLGRLTRLAVDVTVLPDLEGLQAPILQIHRIGALPVVDLEFRPLSPAKAVVKRTEDLILGGLLTLFVMPVLIAAAIAIKLDSPGPVLFRQKRAGFNDGTFMVWKFRTMYHHNRDDLALRQTTRNDARVTRVGSILRRTSLDELPQLLNVLRGEMSIVGPRPHALGMTAVGAPLREVSEDYSARHRLKPGITGWAQINGSRGEVDSHAKLRRRVALDCHYIDNWSLGLDLWIIMRTALIVFGRSNAY